MRSRRMKALLAIGWTALVLGAVGCKEKGPAEKAGEKLDEAADKIGDAINPKGPAEKVGEKIDDALD